ncbi:MAG TPA: sugar transferase [Candidatus Dormibacteraeota bacterium]|nr:sugar transferase [Candidatus Dormibacteraeota bacterium]
MKRAFDVAVAAVGIVVVSPLLLAAAVAVKASSPGPVFYRGVRVGRNGEIFHIYKFRTMRVGADTQGPPLTSAGDPRVTGIGRLLRRTKFDETPQLLNVLRGEMSLVGPRPEHPDFVERYSPEQRQVLTVRPGITGPTALAFLDEEQMLGDGDPVGTYVSSIMPRKLAMDLEYVRTATFAGDVKLLVQTVARVLRIRRG